MNDDDILQAIRATREAFAAAHNYDIRAMGETLKKMNLSGRKVVNFEDSPSEKSATDAQAEVDHRLSALRAESDSTIPREQVEADAMARLSK